MSNPKIPTKKILGLDSLIDNFKHTLKDKQRKTGIGPSICFMT